MEPLISVIIPTYNRAQVILRAINSVVSQSFQDFELIIIDDGSNDETREVVDKFFYEKGLGHQKYRYFFIKNHGVSYARNTGAKFARGEWLAFLDSDDEWLEDKLLKQVNIIKENSELKIVHGNEVWIRNGVRVNPMKKHQKFGGDIFTKCLPLCLMSPSTIIIKKDLFFYHKGFREDFPVCEDYDFWLKLTYNNPVGFVEDFIINKYGGHPDQLSRRFNSMDYYRIIALNEILMKHPNMSRERKHFVVSEIKKKCSILLNGMYRHKNFVYFDKISKIKDSLEYL